VSEQVLYDINSDGFISITAAFAYGITLGKQSKFQIRFDEEVKVLDVMGENIDRWEISHPKATGLNQQYLLTTTDLLFRRKRGGAMENPLRLHDSADGSAVQCNDCRRNGVKL